MSMRVVIQLNDFERLSRQMQESVERRIRELAIDGERYVKQSFGTSPSLPGDPPGVDTGALRASMRTDQIGRMKYAIRPGTNYAHYLEFGTTRMAARPFMQPLADWLRGEIQREFRGGLL